MNYIVILDLIAAGLSFIASVAYLLSPGKVSLLAAVWFINACMWSLNAGLNFNWGQK